MALEYFLITVGTIAIISIPVLWLKAVDAIEEIKFSIKHPDWVLSTDDIMRDVRDAELLYSFILKTPVGSTVYVSHKIMLDLIKTDSVLFSEDQKNKCTLFGRVIKQDESEPLFRAEKE